MNNDTVKRFMTRTRGLIASGGTTWAFWWLASTSHHFVDGFAAFLLGFCLGYLIKIAAKS